jgi:tight adherence protein C
MNLNILYLHNTIVNPMMLVPFLIFFLVFGLLMSLMRQQSPVSARLARYRTSADGTILYSSPAGVASRRPRLQRPAFLDRFVARFSSEKNAHATRMLLSRAGQPMSFAAYGRMRQLFMYLITPLVAILALFGLGQTALGFAATAIVVITVPRLPAMRLKRLAKKRAREMDSVISDVLDLLVVCVEGGQSLPAALMQVATRMDNVAAEEFRHLLSDINSGMSRRDAFLALADRCQSEALGVVCTTIVQADKIGMGIARTLRTLSDTMRTRRRQAAESRARQAPIKMMPVLVGFMLPAMLALLLGPVALEVMNAFK